MKKAIPAWAMRRAAPDERDAAPDARSRGTLQIKWPDLKALRGWARQQGWPAPLAGFEAAFAGKLLENDANFALGLNASGIELSIPKPSATVTLETLTALDGLYAQRSDGGQPVGWGRLVEELRDIRRAVEAGVALTIEGGPAMRTWQEFYAWAHGRYHMLEDGYDHWIGDDNS